MGNPDLPSEEHREFLARTSWQSDAELEVSLEDLRELADSDNPLIRDFAQKVIGWTEQVLEARVATSDPLALRADDHPPPEVLNVMNRMTTDQLKGDLDLLRVMASSGDQLSIALLRWVEGELERRSEPVIDGGGHLTTRGQYEENQVRDEVQAGLGALTGNFASALTFGLTEDPHAAGMAGALFGAFGGAARGRNEMQQLGGPDSVPRSMPSAGEPPRDVQPPPREPSVPADEAAAGGATGADDIVDEPVLSLPDDQGYVAVPPNPVSGSAVTIIGANGLVDLPLPDHVPPVSMPDPADLGIVPPTEADSDGTGGPDMSLLPLPDEASAPGQRSPAGDQADLPLPDVSDSDGDGIPDMSVLPLPDDGAESGQLVPATDLDEKVGEDVVLLFDDAGDGGGMR